MPKKRITNYEQEYEQERERVIIFETKVFQCLELLGEMTRSDAQAIAQQEWLDKGYLKKWKPSDTARYILVMSQA